MDNNSTKILFCGGATGGHLFPALALFEKFREFYGEDKLEYLFIGSNYGLESDVLPKKGLNFKSIWIRGIQRGWSWQDMKVNIFSPLRILVSLLQSAIYVKSFDPDFAIGTGGYSAGPPLYVAAKMDIPIFLQEQNIVPGITTRLLAKHSERIYTAFEDSRKYLPRTKNYGIPLRNTLNKTESNIARDYFDLDPDSFTIFLFGGSQGSRALNLFLSQNIDKIIDRYDCQFIWQTGKNEYDKLRDEFEKNDRIHLTSFIDRMEMAYSAASLVISRAGALTIAELCAMGIPSILVPLPTAAANHQEQNAKELQKNGAAEVILEEELNYTSAKETLDGIIEDKNRLNKMAKSAQEMSNPRAGEKIVNDINSIMREK